MTGLPLISLMLLAPLAGIALVWLIRDPNQARRIAFGAALVSLAFALAVLARFDASARGMQMIEKMSWIPTLGINYHVGIDGISVLFLPLTGLLFLGVILGAWTAKRSMPRLYFSLLLMLLSMTLGIFVALDTILFFLFWELTVVPIYFLLSLWGAGPQRRFAATKYTLFMLVGSVPLLLAFVLLAIGHGDGVGGLSFDYQTLLANPVSGELQVAVFFLLLFGFAIKVPVFPFHTWLPVVAMESTAGIAAVITGIKVGAYGLIRWVIPLAPEAAADFHWLLAGFGVVGIIYGALMAITQTNLRGMLAYASISHVGLVVLGIASQNLQGVQGALFQLVNFTIVAGGLYLMTGFLRHRTGSNETLDLGGVFATMPLFTAFFLLLGMAGLGVPGTNGFPAEFLILMSALQTHTGAGIVALAAMVLGAAYFLPIFRKVFLGPVTSNAVAQAVDLRPRELVVVAVLGSMVLLLGLFPGLVLDVTREAGSAWVQHIVTARP